MTPVLPVMPEVSSGSEQHDMVEAVDDGCVLAVVSSKTTPGQEHIPKADTDKQMLEPVLEALAPNGNGNGHHDAAPGGFHDHSPVNDGGGGPMHGGFGQPEGVADALPDDMQPNGSNPPNGQANGPPQNGAAPSPAANEWVHHRQQSASAGQPPNLENAPQVSSRAGQEEYIDYGDEEVATGDYSEQQLGASQPSKERTTHHNEDSVTPATNASADDGAHLEQRKADAANNKRRHNAISWEQWRGTQKPAFNASRRSRSRSSSGSDSSIGSSSDGSTSSSSGSYSSSSDGRRRRGNRRHRRRRSSSSSSSGTSGSSSSSGSSSGSDSSRSRSPPPKKRLQMDPRWKGAIRPMPAGPGMMGRPPMAMMGSGMPPHAMLPPGAMPGPFRPNNKMPPGPGLNGLGPPSHR